MRKENRPLSEERRMKMYEDMGALIQEIFPLLEKRAITLHALESYDSSEEIHRLSKLMMETHLTVIYAIIEVAIVLRADFRATENAERRENLKYITFVILEFYKSLFLKKKNGKRVWDEVAEVLAESQSELMQKQINAIEDSVQKFKEQYFNDVIKTKRDVSVHYDFDLELMYQMLVNTDEEKDCQMVNAFLAIATPINRLLHLMLPYVESEQSKALFQTSTKEEALRDALSKKLPQFEQGIDHFSQSLDGIMKNVKISNILTEKNPLSLSVDTSKEVYGITNMITPGALAHYFYIDISVAMKGYLCAESLIERRWHLTRMYLIIYEGYKKMFGNKEGDSLWERYIRKPLEGEESYISEIEEVETGMDGIMQDKKVEDIRNKYVHIRNGKKFYFSKLLYFMADLDAEEILNKALCFVLLLNQMTNLSKDALDARKNRIETIKEQL